MTREEVIDTLRANYPDACYSQLREAVDIAINILCAEPLTDKEKRIFLSAMSREEKVCMEVDEKHPSESYEDTLLSVCRSVTRKVKGALWV